LQQLRERISKEVVDVSVQELIPLLRSLKEFVKEESEVSFGSITNLEHPVPNYGLHRP
jgi:hypothetical protein